MRSVLVLLSDKASWATERGLMGKRDSTCLDQDHPAYQNSPHSTELLKCKKDI